MGVCSARRLPGTGTIDFEAVEHTRGEAYSDEEEAEVMERLKDLGYIS